MKKDESPSVYRAFARPTRRTCFGLVIVAVIVFAIASERLLNGYARRVVVDQARVCAAALTPGPNGDLTGSIDRLRVRHKGLAAVATLDASGALHTVYPDESAYRTAISASLHTKHEPVAASVFSDGRSRQAWCVTVALNGSSEPTARKVAFLLWHDSYTTTWLQATMVFAFVTVVTGVICSERLIERFVQQVADPLRCLATLAQNDATSTDALTAVSTGGLHEIERIAGRFTKLIRQHRQIEHETCRRIRSHQEGFDRRLRRAEDRATRDSLTGLRNRAFLETGLDLLFERQKSGGDDLSIAMIDLDNFKQYNDTHGHKAGDDVLRFVGELFCGVLRSTDHAVRYGGDEFVLILPGIGHEQTEPILERILKLFAQYAQTRNSSVPLSMSAGIVSLKCNPCESGAELLRKADAALYRAKRGGKNVVAVGAS